MTELQDKASPIYGLTSVLAYELSELRKEQVITNNLLCTLCDAKDAQQVSDDEKHDDWLRQKTQSTYLNVFGISIACSALYISIFGIDDSVIMWLRSLM
tara:strand:- start:1 stop:297 length:297 start_codon:yes stop_codon:yes gene_type:complete